VARPDLLILCYHAVSGSWPNPGAIDPAVLERQVAYLLRRGYRPETLSAALAAEHGERSLVVSFDDAFSSVLERGLPVLRRLGVPATLFVPTDFAAEAAPMTWSTLGRWLGTEHEHELRCMSWPEIRQIVAEGWEVGSHTCSHPKLTTLDPQQAEAELVRSRQICEEQLQRACPSLAYPFGLHDERVLRLAADAGYESAVTLGERLLGARRRGQMLELSREGIYRGTRWPHFLLATSPALGRLRGARIYRRLASR
jgi:peptidoglycan/xylan/chitin deacetylase (PgdA/CDA1 family)